MNQGEFLYLSRSDVEQINLPMIEIINALDEMFKEKGQGRVEMPPKPGIHTRPDAFIHAMPAYIPGTGAAGVKWVSGYPENQQKGLPYISGLLILNDADTGVPLALMDATWITAKRTGAATAVAAKYLARPESSSLGILACGVQGRTNLEALAELFNITTIKAYDIYPEVAQKFAAEMAGFTTTEIEVVKQPRDAVEGMDLVVTSGPILKTPKPTIKAGWLKAGAFASPVDFDSYFFGEAFAELDKLATDDLAQMAYYRQSGYFKETPQPYADLGQIAAGIMPGREHEAERIASINLGLALDDMATAPLIYKQALEKGIGSKLPL
ncbi:MAG: ornithine cyclodeaminase family protein [Candidatus Promineifilaceae bacterium]